MTAAFFLLMLGGMLVYSGFENVPFGDLLQGKPTKRPDSLSGDTQSILGNINVGNALGIGSTGPGGSSGGVSGSSGSSGSPLGRGASSGRIGSSLGIGSIGVSGRTPTRSHYPALDFLRRNHISVKSYLAHTDPLHHMVAHAIPAHPSRGGGHRYVLRVHAHPFRGPTVHQRHGG